MVRIYQPVQNIQRERGAENPGQPAEFQGFIRKGFGAVWS
jgi:hypothetical protein